MRKLRARYGMERIRVDLTGVNAYGIRLLEALGSKHTADGPVPGRRAGFVPAGAA